MTKKKASTEVVVNNATFSKTEVSNSVNLNLNQNDIMDIAIQDELVVIEKQLEEAEKELDMAKKDLNLVRDNYLIDSCVNTISKKNDYKKFLEICKLLGIKDPKIKIEQYDTIEKKIGVYHKASFVDYNGKNLSYRTVKTSINEYSYDIDIPNMMNVTVYAIEKTKDISLENDSCFSKPSDNPLYVKYCIKNINLDVNTKKELFGVLKPIAKNINSLLEEVFQLKLRIAELEGGEKRIKAHILKTSLKKSSEGRAVLAMLEESKKTRLLLQ